MGSYITESSRSLHVSGSYDVVVVGGGIAGVAAAIAASRNGVKVCLVEKGYSLGGLATLGNVVGYLPLCDGMGNQVIKGIGEELLKLSGKDIVKSCKKMSLDVIPSCWKKGGDKKKRLQQRYQIDFNPTSFMLELETLVIKSGITLYYDTRFCNVVKNQDMISAIIIENKSGRSALKCNSVIDASGDADVCACAGEETVSLNTNVRCGWYYYTDGSEVKLVKYTKPFDFYGKRIAKSGRSYAGDNAEDVTAQVIDSRKLMIKQLKELKLRDLNNVIYPVNIPTFPTFRMTRRLKGKYELEEKDDRIIFEDTIGMTGHWRIKGPIYSIPFRCIKGVATDNLFTAGRCISSGTTGWDITRTIPACAVTGEAAGTAAAMANRFDGRISLLDIKSLQNQLIKQKVIIEVVKS